MPGRGQFALPRPATGRGNRWSFSPASRMEPQSLKNRFSTKNDEIGSGDVMRTDAGDPLAGECALITAGLCRFSGV